MGKQAWGGEGRGRRTDGLERAAPPWAKAPSNMIRNRRKDEGLVRREGARPLDQSWVDVGGSLAQECAKMGKVEETGVCLCTKAAEGNELAREQKICMRRLKLKN